MSVSEKEKIVKAENLALKSILQVFEESGGFLFAVLMYAFPSR